MKCFAPAVPALLLGLAFFLSAPLAGRAQDAPPDAPPPGFDPNGAPTQDANAPDAGGDDQGVSYQTFYDQLGNDGTWVQTDNYGYVFQPNVSDDPNWAPYTDGHWVYTDDGWMWVSDEPWGWATYHYGRWAFVDGLGWIWVPGYQWAPAWVSWRYGDGYAGWAPLPPDASYRGQGSYHFGGDVDASFHIRASNYNFVRTSQLGASNVRTAIVGRSRNSALFGSTTNVTNINVGRGFGHGSNAAFASVSAGGPPIAAVNAHATHKVPTVRLTTASTPGISAVHGNSVAVFAPHLNAAAGTQARPASVSRNVGRVNVSSGAAVHTPATTHHTATAPATEESTATGEPSAISHHQATEASPAFHSAAAEPQVQHHTTEAAPVERTQTEAAPQVEHHTQQFSPAAHESAPSFEHHESAPPVEHHESMPQAVHQNAPPAEHHESAPAQHAAPPPAAKPAAAPANNQQKP
jgi:hypothetical protein